MRRISVSLLLLVLCSATAVHAQTPAPKPDPELKKLNILLGYWALEGESQPEPWGPAGKFTFEEGTRWTLGGFYLETRSKQSREIDAYDPANKNFTFAVYNDDGSTYSGVFTINGKTETYSGTGFLAGKRCQIMGTVIFAPDFLSYAWKQEFSTDGKTWTLGWEAKGTKVKPQPTS